MNGNEPLDIPNGLDGYESPRNDMVSDQLVARGIQDRAVLQTMRKVPRHRFVSPDQAESAYNDSPLEIGEEQTISQPYIVGLMTQAVSLAGSEKILEIGTGSGYQTAVLAELAGSVYSVERLETLAAVARERLGALGYGAVHLRIDDGSIGWAEHAPYDGIVVTACAPGLPSEILAQLRVGGTLVLPIGDLENQTLYAVEKLSETETKKSVLCPCRFVCLFGQAGFQPSSADE